MKTIFIILTFVAAFVALFEQSKTHPNKIVIIIAIVIFIAGLMNLMSKVPSKNREDE